MTINATGIVGGFRKIEHAPLPPNETGIYHLFAYEDYDSEGFGCYVGVFHTLGDAFEWFDMTQKNMGDICVIAEDGALKQYLTYKQWWDQSLGNWVYGWIKSSELEE